MNDGCNVTHEFIRGNIEMNDEPTAAHDFNRGNRKYESWELGIGIVEIGNTDLSMASYPHGIPMNKFMGWGAYSFDLVPTNEFVGYRMD